jgi:hypothetical protein
MCLSEFLLRQFPMTDDTDGTKVVASAAAVDSSVHSVCLPKHV